MTERCNSYCSWIRWRSCNRLYKYCAKWTTISTLCELYICTERYTVLIKSESFSLNVRCLPGDVDIVYVAEIEILSWALSYLHRRGTRWRSWLRHCATSRKVLGSITDVVIGIFHWNSPSGFTKTLGVDSASKRNEYQGYFLGRVGGKGGRCVGLTTLLPSCADCFEICESQPPGILRAYPGL